MNRARVLSQRCLVLIGFVLILLSSLPAGATELSELVAEGEKVKLVADGCRFTEGPAFSPSGFLLFSDIPNSRILRLEKDDTIVSFIEPSGRSNGLMFDGQGFLYACQGGSRRVVRIDPTNPKDVKVLAEAFEGKKLNSPNDLALDNDGGLYFTDPRYGQEDDLEQKVMGVYYVSSVGKVTRVVDSLVKPNGVLVSPDGKSLYVAEWAKGEIHRYAITGPGKIGSGEKIFKGDAELDGERGPDGMAHDANGNIYATYKGITVLDPKGALVGRIATPKRPANCTFGGPDQKTLYITARDSLFSVAMKVRGASLRKTGPGAKFAKPVKLKSLVLNIPTSWKREKPKSSMRLGQFTIPAAAGAKTAELAVFSFPGGGSIDANVQRWVSQFDPEGRKGKVSIGKCSQGDYAIVDIAGTYMASSAPRFGGPKKPLAGWRVINVAITMSDGMYFLKLSGSYKLVAAALEDLRISFGANKDEKTREIE